MLTTTQELEHGGLLIENPVNLDSVVRDYIQEESRNIGRRIFKLNIRLTNCR